MNGIPLAPPNASTSASQVDLLFTFELCVAAFFVLLIFVLVVYFAIRYRRRSEDEVPQKVPSQIWLEITWTLIPFGLMLVMYFWGASLFVHLRKPVHNALEIHVIGKQWMWKIEHPGGMREINELHVPVGEPVKLILSSQDVIHDFFIPAFRVKQDVVPGCYVTEWFVPTQMGRYHLFCSQYCGTDHARMVGWVDVMAPDKYEAWVAGVAPAEAPAAVGEGIFTSYGCAACHGQRGPTLAGLYGSKVRLQDGSTVTADEDYLRSAILSPAQQLVAGYPPIMPSYRGQLSEEQLYQLIAYIKSLGAVHNAVLPATTPAPQREPTTHPAVGDQPSAAPNFPPAEAPNPIRPPRGESEP